MLTFIRIFLNVSVLLYFLFIVAWFVQLLADIWQRRRFRNDLSAAIIHSQPDWSDVLELARQAPVKTKIAVDEILKLKRKILIGKDTKLEQHKTLLESYIKSYRETEPFDGLPNDIRNPLERVKQSADPNTFNTLVVQIRKVIAFQESVNRRQRFYTAGGFLITLIALLFSAYAYRWPYPAPSPATAQADQAPKK